MTRRLLRLAQLPVFVTIALVVVLVALPGRRELALHVYWLVLAGFGLAVLVGVVRRAHPVPPSSQFDVGLRRTPPAQRKLAELERLEREVTLATSTAFDVHIRLRPRVRRIAAYLLATRRGVDLDAQPELARRLLGEPTWELVRAERPVPSDRNAGGLDVPALRELVASLERLS